MWSCCEVVSLAAGAKWKWRCTTYVDSVLLCKFFVVAATAVQDCSVVVVVCLKTRAGCVSGSLRAGGLRLGRVQLLC